MKKYRVEAMITISISTVVEAKTQAEAIRIAEERDLPHIFDQATETEWATSGELDGTPFELTAEVTKD